MSGRSEMLRGWGFPEKENLRRLARLAFGVRGLLVGGADLALFFPLQRGGISGGTAQLLSYFPAAALFYLLIVRPGFIGKGNGDPRPSSRWPRPILFFFFSLLALFLRGGILATGTLSFDWPAGLAILPASLLPFAVLLLACASYLLPGKGAPLSADERWGTLSGGMIVYALLLRLAYPGAVPLLGQEAYYWNYAQRLDLGYLDHPPMVAWVIWLMTRLHGDTELGVRLGGLAGWGVMAFFVAKLARNLFDSSTALRAVLLVSVLPFFFSMGLVTTPDSFLVASWAGCLHFLERSLLGGDRRGWWGAGVCAGLGLLSKYTIVLLGPTVLLFLILDRPSRRWLKRIGPYGAAFLAFLLFLPVLIWNAQHGWASFIFQGSRRFLDTFSFTLPELLGSVLLLLTPTGALAVFVALGSRAEAAAGEHPAADGRRRLFLGLFTLFPFLFFAAFSLVRTAKLNWTGPLWLAAIPFIARQMSQPESLRAGRPLRWVQRAWLPTLLFLLFLYGMALHFWALGIPGIPYPGKGEASLLVGWPDLAEKVERIDQEIRASRGVKPLVVGMDKCYIASELIFYRNRKDRGKNKAELLALTTGRHLFGMDSLMYRFWFPRERESEFRKENSILLLVTRELQELKAEKISSHGWNLGEVHALEVQANGRAAGRYYYALARPK